jgi:3-oxoadipate enol-lactonase
MASLTLNGLTVEYAQYGAGPDLLLVHSLLTEMSVFEKVLPSLSEARRVTTINLPGFGASSPTELNSVGEVADHVAAVMAALKLPNSTDVFANGFGAFVALELAIRHGEKFRRLLVADCVPAFPEAGRAPFRGMAQKVRTEGMGAVLDAAIGRMFPPAFQQAEPEVVKLRKQRLSEVDAQCFARACLALAEMDLSPKLPSIKNPARVMCGALDLTTVPALAREVAALIPGAQYHEIINSGHCPMLEQPDNLVRLILEFIVAR